VPDRAADDARVSVRRVRFGSLDLRLIAEPRHFELFPFHFRAWPEPDEPSAPDVELTIHDDPRLRTRIEELDDRLEIHDGAGTTRIESTISELVIDERTHPTRSQLVLWPTGQDPKKVEHYVVMNLRTLLRRLGRIQLHGAAATLGTRTVVLLGDKGAGKSTLSLAIGRGGGTVLADDQLMLHVHGAEVRISGVDGGLRVTEQTERHFFAEPLQYEPQDFGGTMKKEVPLRAHVPATPGVDVVPTACYFPCVGERLEVVPIGRAVAMRRILDAVVPLHRFAGPIDQQDFVRAITTFVRSVDVFDLTLSPDLHELDRVVDVVARAAP
jgi:hypothetical protein